MSRLDDITVRDIAIEDKIFNEANSKVHSNIIDTSQFDWTHLQINSQLKTNLEYHVN